MRDFSGTTTPIPSYYNPADDAETTLEQVPTPSVLREDLGAIDGVAFADTEPAINVKEARQAIEDMTRLTPIEPPKTLHEHRGAAPHLEQSAEAQIDPVEAEFRRTYTKYAGFLGTYHIRRHRAGEGNTKSSKDQAEFYTLAA